MSGLIYNKFKFELDKTSKKYKCPGCGQKRYVRYVDKESEEYISDDYGRCDREEKCGYFKSPSSETLKEFTYNYTIPVVTKPESRPSYVDMSIVQRSLDGYDINPFVNYLYNNFEREDVERSIEMYKVGTSKQYNGSTVFWQVDHTGLVRSGKIMGYDSETGKRVKKERANPEITWAHRALKMSDFNFKQCLFGEHLLKNNPKHIGIVESEKTAIIMSIQCPEITWLATSSSVNFKYETLIPLKLFSSSQIVAYPDKGCYGKWSEVVERVKLKINIGVSDVLEGEDYKDLDIGSDIADIILSQLAESCQ